MKFQDSVKTMKKNRNKYYKKYYKKHKKEIYAKVKKWREKQKQNKFLLENTINCEWAGKYGNLIHEVVKEQLNFQIVNGVEASIDTINYFLKKKDVDAAQIALEQLKRQVNVLSKMIKKGVFDKCIN